MTKAPAFQFYASDFLTDTSAWTAIEVGIYIRLLSTQWVNGFLINDIPRLARISGVSIEDFNKAWVIVGLKFAFGEDGFLRNPKMEKVRAQRKLYLEKQSYNGKKGGRPPKKTLTEPKNNPSLLEDETQTITQKKPLEVEVEIEEEVEDRKENLGGLGGAGRDEFLIPQMLSMWTSIHPKYPVNEEKDFLALGEISRFIQQQEKIPKGHATDPGAIEKTKNAFQILIEHVSNHNFFSRYSLSQVSTHFQAIVQDLNQSNGGQSSNSKNRPKVDLRSAFEKLNQFAD